MSGAETWRNVHMAKSVSVSIVRFLFRAARTQKARVRRRKDCANCISFLHAVHDAFLVTYTLYFPNVIAVAARTRPPGVMRRCGRRRRSAHIPHQLACLPTLLAVRPTFLERSTTARVLFRLAGRSSLPPTAGSTRAGLFRHPRCTIRPWASPAATASASAARAHPCWSTCRCSTAR